ncbi:uncharacterized protein HMPREF1541_01800 [Cyphellophora europaea CBS 101466]|uniref:CoA-transferase family III n=1 Tax=Cyphellophora europaea (strain CBS 101466) TaxID=1220924 RepID=W2S3M4_CYPE1|nr:uncharacterized protein HMPREF1541_01800 [Cyphellophora europaea CBS 101466]ETN42643.1 hypothetical protein HMPREF1541_01800 [Cyphellophora europaea CBS 101466]
MPTTVPDRTAFSQVDSLNYIWTALDLPPTATNKVQLPGRPCGTPTSFQVPALAQVTIALSATAAALIHTSRNDHAELPTITVFANEACIEFKSERFYTIDGQPPSKESSSIGGLHRTSDGWVRIHDSFPHHREAAYRLIGLAPPASPEEIKQKIATLKAVELESQAFRTGAIVGALRSYAQWDASPQAASVSDHPLSVRKIADGPKGWPAHLGAGQKKCLAGLKVLEMTRVIAAPVAGRTLAAHGADVMWVTSPKLPDLPVLDRDTARGKRTVQLDLDQEADMEKLRELLGDVDVFIQSYRPGSLVMKGLSPERLARVSKNGVVYASLSAWGTEGPWAGYRGFDSIVQTVSGLNVAEAEYHGQGEPSKVLPCQALDHASGYLLAFGIMAALYKRATEGGSYLVEVSLAGTMKYLRSLGQSRGPECFGGRSWDKPSDVPIELYDGTGATGSTRPCGFGDMAAIKHSARIDGVEVGYDRMPKKLGSDEATWL